MITSGACYDSNDRPYFPLPSLWSQPPWVLAFDDGSYSSYYFQRNDHDQKTSGHKTTLTNAGKHNVREIGRVCDLGCFGMPTSRFQTYSVYLTGMVHSMLLASMNIVRHVKAPKGQAVSVARRAPGWWWTFAPRAEHMLVARQIYWFFPRLKQFGFQGRFSHQATCSDFWLPGRSKRNQFEHLFGGHLVIDLKWVLKMNICPSWDEFLAASTLDIYAVGL